jgi:hypothetical protein
MAKKVRQQLSLDVRLFLVRVDGFPDVAIQAPTKAAARYEVYRRGRAAGYFVNGFADFLTKVKVARNVRPLTTAEAFDAAMRAITDLSNAARASGDDGLMYAANRAWRELHPHRRNVPAVARAGPVRAAGGDGPTPEAGIDRGAGYWPVLTLGGLI